MLLFLRALAATGWTAGKMYTCNSSGTRKTRLDDKRMVDVPGVSMIEDHKAISLLFLRVFLHIVPEFP
jgi:hypothetical protein